MAGHFTLALLERSNKTNAEIQHRLIWDNVRQSMQAINSG